MSRIRMQFLGGFDVFENDGSRLHLPSRNATAVLAILCVGRERMCSRAKLAAQIWDVWDPEHARASLRQSLFMLRHLVGRDVFRCQGDAIALDPSVVEADIWEFEDLAARHSPDSLLRAVELYQGEFLRGYTPGKGFAFEEWLDGERNRMREAALRVLGRALDHAFAIGTMDGARQAALRMVAIDPAEEIGHRALMRIYAAERRFGLALRQFELCRKMLETELGVEPDAETRALRTDIVHRRSHLRPLPVAIPDRPVAAGCAA
ncbi:MAG: hypothetical protein IPK66_12580 [Rhodospirillales bacterium]|nr:hypothetical protein [Rhodospirillales bacterium]